MCACSRVHSSVFVADDRGSEDFQCGRKTFVEFSKFIRRSVDGTWVSIKIADSSGIVAKQSRYGRTQGLNNNQTVKKRRY